MKSGHILRNVKAIFGPGHEVIKQRLNGLFKQDGQKRRHMAGPLAVNESARHVCPILYRERPMEKPSIDS